MIYNDVRKNENKGFSLVELIVVIAIMAVMTAVLAPSLLQYVERSRAQKDDSAMGEVANAVQSALADQNIYDEVLFYTTYNNVSCYFDTKAEADSKGTKIQTKAGTETFAEQYTYNDDARLADETPYYAGGNMRGVTITFVPENNSNTSLYKLSNGVINKFIGAADHASATTMKTSTGGAVSLGYDTGRTTERATVSCSYINATPDYSTKGLLGEMTSGSTGNVYLYNRVRATVGDTIELSSQTYRNSEYTVFIRMGSTGGNQATAQDAIAVYGQWNGTNLVANPS